MYESNQSLLSQQDAPIVENLSGKGELVIICEHAGRMLPSSLGNLGIDDLSMSSHFAWDIGAASLSRALSRLLDSPLILQRYSRLVFDCNREFDAPDAIISDIDGITIPKNVNLSTDDRRTRYELVYQPFHSAIEQVLDTCDNPAIVTIHSFTPVFMGQTRSLDLGVIHDVDSRLADRVLSIAEQSEQYSAARNEPYTPQDGVAHTLKRHGIGRGLQNIMFEVRNDLIAEKDGQEKWASHLEALLTASLNLKGEAHNDSRL